MMINTQSLIEKGLFVLGMLLHTQIPRVILIRMKLRDHSNNPATANWQSTGPQHNPCMNLLNVLTNDNLTPWNNSQTKPYDEASAICNFNKGIWKHII